MSMKVITLTTQYMLSHCYIIEEDGHALIIDPGDPSLVLDVIKANSYTVDFCILTHEHCDHTYGCSEVRQALGCDIYASEKCNRQLQSSRKNFSEYFDAFIEIQTQLPVEQLKTMDPFKTNADVVFSNEMNIDWMGHRLYLKETPGHSLGSICIVIDDKILFTGDTLLLNEATGTNYPGGNEDDLNQISFPWLKSLSPDTKVYAGHGEAFLLGERTKDL